MSGLGGFHVEMRKTVGVICTSAHQHKGYRNVSTIKVWDKNRSSSGMAMNLFSTCLCQSACVQKGLWESHNENRPDRPYPDGDYCNRLLLPIHASCVSENLRGNTMYDPSLRTCMIAMFLLAVFITIIVSM